MNNDVRAGMGVSTECLLRSESTILLIFVDREVRFTAADPGALRRWPEAV